ncbi:PPE family protein [Mycobacterium sp.]|uniref:PPE family protein n=1 Tax=Mycobacterium sp. TaxID=1785 RepID=UPI0031D41BEA
MDFGLLPPEVNSGRMYAGPGCASIVAAAASWDNLATELHATAASYEAAVTNLTAGWQGPSSAAMAAAAGPYVQWMNSTAAQAEQTAAQAKSAATAYENAFVATVPPTAVAANRSQLIMLIATNLVGQNTAAIAATELQYAEMWAQDAAAMYGYATSSITASALTPFRPPPQTADQGATAAQAIAVNTASGSQSTSALPQVLQSLATTTAAAPTSGLSFTPAEIYYTAVASFLNGTIGPLSPVKLYGPLGSFYDLGVQSFLAPFNNFNMQVAYGAALSKLPAAIGAGSGLSAMTSSVPAVSAELGQAGVVGSLSVPATWAGPAPALTSLASAISPNGLGAVPQALAAEGQDSIFGNMALSGLAGRAITATDGSMARTIGGGAGVVAAETATATIIVIPED